VCFYGNDVNGVLNPTASDPIYGWLYGTHQTDDMRAVTGGNAYHCTDLAGHGLYERRLLLYDANNLVAVKNGQQARWAARPYASLAFTAPIHSNPQYVGGAAFDPIGGRLYCVGADDNNQIVAHYPLIHVFAVTL
jgi:hypothetical protein